MKFLWGSVFLLLSVSCSAIPVGVGDSLRDQMEASMQKARSAVLEGDLDKFLSSIDPVHSKSNVNVLQWEALLGSDNGRKLLLRSVPDLKKDTVFLTEKVRDDWAVYFAETGLDDPNYQTLKAWVFHKSEKGWRPAGKSYGLTKAKPGGEAAREGYPAWSGHEEMLKTIEEDKNFSFETLTTLSGE